MLLKLKRRQVEKRRNARHYDNKAEQQIVVKDSFI